MIRAIKRSVASCAASATSCPRRSSISTGVPYATVNLLYTPVKNMLLGGELQWGHRANFSDGFSVSDTRIQFSAKYSFGVKVGGE